jgi:uncharacterized membrane protein (DUF485 family)
MSSGRFTRADQPGKAQAFDWLAIERTPEFQELVQTRRRIVTRLATVWLVGAIGYLILAAYADGLMAWQIVDGLPFAWLAAISQVLLTWGVAWSYLRAADSKLGPLERRAVEAAERGAR